jgi:hypothetical protein
MLCVVDARSSHRAVQTQQHSTELQSAQAKTRGKARESGEEGDKEGERGKRATLCQARQREGDKETHRHTGRQRDREADLSSIQARRRQRVEEPWSILQETPCTRIRCMTSFVRVSTQMLCRECVAVARIIMHEHEMILVSSNSC